MKITVFTANQPRHISLIRDLASIANKVYAVQECTTLFHGQVQDFYRKSEVMQTYFTRVIQAEKDVFGGVAFSPSNVSSLPIKSGDLNFLSMEDLKPALSSDIYIVFGGSFIKGPLIEFLVEHKALNIHMGVSPYYRGAACNFWAVYDGNPNLVGGTIHRLSKGLDSGPMLFHALPAPGEVDPFLLGMQAVRAAHNGLLENLKNGNLFKFDPVAQDKSMQIRYTRNAEFTDEIAKGYLERKVDAKAVGQMFKQAQQRELLRPYVLAAEGGAASTASALSAARL